MPTALFLYVFSAKRDPSGKITLESLFKGTKRNPERLAQCGLVPSITKRNVTFKASFDYKKGEIRTRDLKIIQAEVDRELRFSVGISLPYRVWNNALMAIPSLKANPELRKSFVEQIGAKSEIAQRRYHELMTTGTISGEVPSPETTSPPVEQVQQAAADSAMEWGGEEADASEARDQVAAIVSSGEGSFAAEDGDELADLIGGLAVADKGGRRRRLTKRRRARKNTRRY